MDHLSTSSASVSDEQEGNRPFCTICGDVKACLHKPDAIVRAAWDQEHQNGLKRGEAGAEA